MIKIEPFSPRKSPFATPGLLYLLPVSKQHHHLDWPETAFLSLQTLLALSPHHPSHYNLSRVLVMLSPIYTSFLLPSPHFLLLHHHRSAGATVSSTTGAVSQLVASSSLLLPLP